MSFESLGKYLKPWGRAVKYGALKRHADRIVAQIKATEAPAVTAGSSNIAAATSGLAATNGSASQGGADFNGSMPPRAGAQPRLAFLIGCGRSGTTVVGDVLGAHPKIKYFFEPYHLWATVDPGIDVLNLYHRGPARLLLDADDATPLAIRRFDALFLARARERGAELVVEKTPFNACRIGYLEAMRPGSRFIHLVRDGADVARSIARLSRDRSYRIAGKPVLNRWWGLHGCKWSALALDGKAHGYFAGEVDLLRSDESKGAYEWMVSLREVENCRSRLGDRLMEMSYEQLTTRPRESVEAICRFLEIDVSEKWIRQAQAQIDKPRRHQGPPLILPPEMCAAFNACQERFGFIGRAEVGEPKARKVRVTFISNEPTPYRLHVLKRLLRELPEAHVESVFTHTISKPSMPWEMMIDPDLNPVFFPEVHLSISRPISLRSIPLFLRIRRHLHQNDVQLVIILGYNDLTRLLTISSCHGDGIPILLTGDSNVFCDAQARTMVRMVKRPLLRWVMRRLAGIMPMGTCGRAFYRQYLNHRLPEFLFPYEPDYSALVARDENKIAAFRKKHGMATSRRRFLCCGRLVPVKRVDLLLEAFCAVAPRRPDWDLVIAGDGPLGPALRASVPPGLRHRIIWLGFAQFDEVKLAYQACDALVHPSTFEPWGLVINEAVACDLPIITTSVVGAAVELVRHGSNGLLVQPRSAEAFAAAMLELSEGDACQQMKIRCRPMLDAWRRAADPVEGVRQALQFFGLTEAITPEPQGRIDAIPGDTVSKPVGDVLQAPVNH